MQALVPEDANELIVKTGHDLVQRRQGKGGNDSPGKTV